MHRKTYILRENLIIQVQKHRDKHIHQFNIKHKQDEISSVKYSPDTFRQSGIFIGPNKR